MKKIKNKLAGSEDIYVSNKKQQYSAPSITILTDLQIMTGTKTSVPENTSGVGQGIGAWDAAS
jgi:hypothetical protein